MDWLGSDHVRTCNTLSRKNRTSIARQRCSKHVFVTIREVVFLCGPSHAFCHVTYSVRSVQNGYKQCSAGLTRVLLLLTESGKRQTRPLVRENPTSTSLQLSDSNKYLVLSPRWVLYSKTDWPTEPLVVT
jgi:hypothetical protein